MKNSLLKVIKLSVALFVLASLYFAGKYAYENYEIVNPREDFKEKTIAFSITS